MDISILSMLFFISITMSIVTLTTHAVHGRNKFQSDLSGGEGISLLSFDILAKEFDDDSTSRSNLNTLLKVIEDTRGLKNKTRKHIHDLIVIKDQRAGGGPNGQTQLQHRRIVYEDTIFLERAIREISGKMNMSYEGESRSDPAIHWMILYNDTTILVVRSANKYYYWTYAQTVGSLIIFCMIVVGNASILHRLKSSRRRRSNVNYFIVQLAIADLLVGIFSVTLDSLLRIQKAFVWGLFACRASKYISVLFIYSSTNLLVALSIDRWEAVVKPLAFTRNRSRGYHLVLASWALAFVCAFPVIPYTKVDNIDGLPQCWIDLSNTGWRVYMIYLTSLLLVLPTLIIAVCYTHIVYTIWNKARQVSQQRQQHCAYSSKYTRALAADARGASTTAVSCSVAHGRESNSDPASGATRKTSSSIQQQRIELDKTSLHEDDEILLDDANFSLPKCRRVRETVTRLGQRLRRRCTVEIGPARSPDQTGRSIRGPTTTTTTNCDNRVAAKNININASLPPALTSEEGAAGIEMTQGLAHGSSPPPPSGRAQRAPSASSASSSLIAPSGSSARDESSVGPLEGGGEEEAAAAAGGKVGDILQTTQSTNDIAGAAGLSRELIAGDRRLTGAPDVEPWPVVGGIADKRQMDAPRAARRQRQTREPGQKVAVASSAMALRIGRPSRRAKSEDLGGTRGADDARRRAVKMRTSTTATKVNLITNTSACERATGRALRTLDSALELEAGASRTQTMQATIAASSSVGQIGPQGNRNNENNNNNNHHHSNRRRVKYQAHQATAAAEGNGHQRAPGGRDLDFASQQHGSGVIPKARIKTIKMTLVIVAAYILCWSPFLIVNMCVVFKFIGNNTNVSHALLTLTQSLAHLNSAVNPIIFWIFSSKRSHQTNANTTATAAGGGGGASGGGGMGTTHTSGLFQQIASNGACKSATANSISPANDRSQQHNSRKQSPTHNQKTSSSNM